MASNDLKEEKTKSSEQDNYKGHRKCNIGAKTFTTSSNEKTDGKCLFCKKPDHTLHKCRKFIEKPIKERVKFLQQEKICFGCLEVIIPRPANLEADATHVKNTIQHPYIKTVTRKITNKGRNPNKPSQMKMMAKTTLNKTSQEKGTLLVLVFLV